MGKRLENLYPEEYEWLDYQAIDTLVRAYQAEEGPVQRDIYRQKLLQAFHKYFMKYVALLKNKLVAIKGADTTTFLALFTSKQSKTTYSFMKTYRYIGFVCKHLEDEDIYNELCAMFIQLLDKFVFYENTSFARYITKYMRWAIKAWVMQMAKDPLSRAPCELTDEHKSELYSQRPEKRSIDNGTQLPKLDLGWVSATSKTLFRVLSPYERFLIYLNYKEGLGVRQISERLGRAKDTIHTHIQQALQKLRDQYKKGETHGICN